ncbi:DUF4344 domain-containing metallopeptidase [Brevundimonas sp.]|uniref:DUF4344 domain-containing metallopeptidase n=1 Tax=Brevundimonas sp. TaxID=1871086 RepID=UPI00261CF15D|nr:DUF4344 domain-containing metallopeptidase [Brevundimonas sp.]
MTVFKAERGVRGGIQRAALSALLALGLFAAAVPAAAQDDYEDEGDFYITDAENVTDDGLQEVLEGLEEDEFLEGIVEGLNDSLNLPVDISINFKQCGEENAYYSPDETAITVCLELFTEPREKLAAFYDNDEDTDAAIRGYALAIIYHEVGHAVVNVMEIPITGREEDAVDQFAVWWLSDNDEGDLAVIDAALGFYEDPDGDARTGSDEDSLADEHSLSQQRYYNFLCWVYGSDTSAHADLLEEEWLTAARAERCEAEFEQLNTSWYVLMEGRLKS